jgi:hypothetical protein
MHATALRTASLSGLIALGTTIATISGAGAADLARAAGEPALPGPAPVSLIVSAGGGAALTQANPELTTSQLDVLAADATAWADRSGQVYFIEPKRSPTAVAMSNEQVASVVAQASAAAISTASAFTLESRPGSKRTIYLDFTGDTVSGTAWNNSAQFNTGSAIVAPGYSIDGDPTTFTDAERAQIIDVWQRVSEDYAPFDVNVTTADPGIDAINRTSVDDAVFGTRAVITSMSNSIAVACGCGGVAYLTVFNWAGDHQTYQPAWVFTIGTGTAGADIAEATSHEVGHNLGLSHDGTAALAYYRGHGGWAPIMGAGYGRAVTQWSKGEYTGANNAEDDLAVISAHGATTLADDVGGTAGTATPVASGAINFAGEITTRTDVDVFALDSGPGTITIQAAAAYVGPDLDITLDLRDANGAVVATSSPTGSMGALLSASVAAGRYTVWVDGVGTGDATTGYSDYASIGRYTLTGSVPGGSTPEAPTNLVATAGAGSASITFSPGANGGSAIANYQHSEDNGVTWTLLSPSDASSPIVVPSLLNGTAYSITLRAVNGVGPGAASAPVSVTPRTVPAAPTGLVATAGSGSASIAFTPGAANGSAITNYQASKDNGATWTSLSPAGTSSPVTVTGLTNGTTYSLRLRAVNEAGVGAASTSVSVMPKAIPSTPPVPKLVDPGTGGTLKATWSAASGNGSAITNYVVRYSSDGGGSWSTAPEVGNVRTTVLPGLVNGHDYVMQVRARNVIGLGAWSPSSSPVRPTGKPDAPSGVLVAGGNGSLGATWTRLAPPADGGLAVSYTARAHSTGSSTGTVGTSCTVGSASMANSCIITGLANGTAYYVDVTASNARGSGPASAPRTSGTPAALAPGPPATPSLTDPGTGGTLRASWPAAPGNGSAITNYTVRYSSDGGGSWSTAPEVGAVTNATLPDLVNGTGYVVQVRARNTVGYGPWSVSSAARTPTGRPSAPVSPAAVGGPRSLVVSWTRLVAPDTGGLAVSYTARAHTLASGGAVVGTSCSVGTASSSSTCTVTGLAAGTTYWVDVTATNARGSGPASPRIGGVPTS